MQKVLWLDLSNRFGPTEPSKIPGWHDASFLVFAWQADSFRSTHLNTINHKLTICEEVKVELFSLYAFFFTLSAMDQVVMSCNLLSVRSMRVTY